MKALLMILVPALVFFCSTPLLQAEMSGGFSFDDLRVSYSAHEKDGVHANLWVATVYQIEDFSSYFWTARNDPTRYEWGVKLNVNLNVGPTGQPEDNSFNVSWHGFTIDAYSDLVQGSENDQPWNYLSSSFFLDPATVTSARFYWDDRPEELISGYASGKLEIEGYLTGLDAAEFGQAFQQVPELATLVLISVGSLLVWRRRQRQ